jgi:Ca2+-transporting ATPase
VTEIPFLVRAFGTASLSLKEWQILVGLAAMPLVAHEVLVLAGKVRKRR